jgi:uncharacterized repeat protein (TIGR03803 family)
MHPAATKSRMNGFSAIPDLGPGFGSTKPAAGAPNIRAFCECVGVSATRGALVLAMLSALLLILTTTQPALAQTETVLYNFCSGPNCSDGWYPGASLTPDGKGNFYGTTEYSGFVGAGTVFELSPNSSGGWNQTVVYSFSGGADGRSPNCNVIFDSAGNLYGTASLGGAYGYGVVWKLSPIEASWTETVLYSVAHGEGKYPINGLVVDASGNLYGTSEAADFLGKTGTVFELSPSASGWTHQVIRRFQTAGAGLTMDAAGNIFSATNQQVFELSPNGSGGWNTTVIHFFNPYNKDGHGVRGTPVLDEAGNLYGTTEWGGANGYGTVYKLSLVTTGKRKGKWTEQILYSFTGGPNDGGYPYGGVVLDAAGNIYGTTTRGGNSGYGTVFELIAAQGEGIYQEKVLWSFNGTDGDEPQNSLILDSAGNLFGTTSYGGSSGRTCFGGLIGCGVVFELTP